MNRLYYGDNLTIMQEQMASQSVDLIYLDPPFNSKKNYNLIYEQVTGKPVPAQADAFCDTWELDAEKQELASKLPIIMKGHGIEDYYVKFWKHWIDALRHTHPKLLAYLIYMAQRLLHMKILLRPAGSIYLHCDPNACHYIKVMMDAVFGHKNFRGEIVWKRTTAHSDSLTLGAVHDIILHYSASSKFTKNPQFSPYSQEYIDAWYKHQDTDGRLWMSGDWTAKGLTGGGYEYEYKGRKSIWRGPIETMQRLDVENRLHFTKNGIRIKRYLDEGKGVAVNDLWTDIPPIPSRSKERVGYPTQKPTPLLKRILQLSSNKGDKVFDPFCGCGTTTYAAHETGREWVGCDIAILAIKLIKYNLEKSYGLKEEKDFQMDGIPVSVEGAMQLFKKDPFQFQHWAVERVDGFPTLKKVADKGIDGNIYFETEHGFNDMVISVKGGIIRPTDIRDLRGVLERDKEGGTVLAGFISNKEPTKAMKEEASKAGMYSYMGTDYPRIQLLTTKQILEDKQELKTPSKIGAKKKKGQLNLDVINA